jgi:hypothetical protein
MQNVHSKVSFHLKHGALHHDLGIPAGQKIPASVERKDLSKAKASGNTTEQRRLQFALNARKFNH